MADRAPEEEQAGGRRQGTTEEGKGEDEKRQRLGGVRVAQTALRHYQAQLRHFSVQVFLQHQSQL